MPILGDTHGSAWVHGLQGYTRLLSHVDMPHLCSPVLLMLSPASLSPYIALRCLPSVAGPRASASDACQRRSGALRHGGGSDQTGLVHRLQLCVGGVTIECSHRWAVLAILQPTHVHGGSQCVCQGGGIRSSCTACIWA
jgi:hypothetical protein